MRGNREGYQFVDREALNEQHNEAVESGVLDPEKVKARVNKLAKEYEARKAERNSNSNSDIDKDPTNIFIEDVKKMSEEFNSAENPEEKQVLADKMRKLFENIFAVRFVEQKK